MTQVIYFRILPTSYETASLEGNDGIAHLSVTVMAPQIFVNLNASLSLF